MNTIPKKLAFYFLLLFFFAVSCKDDDPSPNQEYAYVNNWIYDNMKFWYYWNSSLVSNPDKNKDPETFFESLLTNEDRFSWIQDNYQELLNSLQGVNLEAGYEFVLYKESESSNNVIAQIVYIKPNSPAASTPLKRGDVITHINGTQTTTDNYRDQLNKLSANHSITYKALDLPNQAFGNAQTLSLSVLEYAENPNFMHKVIESNGHKIGYYIYNFFAQGTNDSYDNEMDAIFTDFKNQGITDLVLDLRYNSGGSESSANNLASLIANNITSNDIFAKKQYNPGVEQAIIDEIGADYLTSRFQVKTANVGNMLQGNRVFVLTSSRTASASELIINALRPFMQVYIIGNTTYGKNVGSISLYEENDPKNKWGMQPIVVKVFNSANESNYSEGFTPDILDKDNSLYLHPLGEPDEVLLKHAIETITGISSGGRMAQVEGKEFVGHSLDLKKRSYNLIMDKESSALRRALLQQH